MCDAHTGGSSPTAYSVFQKVQWAAARAEKAADASLPPVTLTLMGPLVATRWKAMTEEERAPFQQQAKVQKEQQ